MWLIEQSVSLPARTKTISNANTVPSTSSYLIQDTSGFAKRRANSGLLLWRPELELNIERLGLDRQRRDVPRLNTEVELLHPGRWHNVKRPEELGDGQEDGVARELLARAHPAADPEGVGLLAGGLADEGAVFQAVRVAEISLRLEGVRLVVRIGIMADGIDVGQDGGILGDDEAPVRVVSAQLVSEAERRSWPDTQNLDKGGNNC